MSFVFVAFHHPLHHNHLVVLPVALATPAAIGLVALGRRMRPEAAASGRARIPTRHWVRAAAPAPRARRRARAAGACRRGRDAPPRHAAERHRRLGPADRPVSRRPSRLGYLVDTRTSGSRQDRSPRRRCCANSRRQCQGGRSRARFFEPGCSPGSASGIARWPSTTASRSIAAANGTRPPRSRRVSPQPVRRPHNERLCGAKKLTARRRLVRESPGKVSSTQPERRRQCRARR